MAKYLVVVESPTKVKSLKKYLGADFEVLASKGHVKDLPGRSLGVDVDKNFEPQYVTIPGKEKILKEITDLAHKVDTVYLAPDPDREGEAIAWHIASELDLPKKSVQRVLIQEITQKGIQEAIKSPASLDPHKFESQQARRILDRLVGYQISPLLWKKVKRGLSAGRVQSVAVRLICEREGEIRKFIPEEYWTIETSLEAAQPPRIQARLVSVDQKKIGKDFRVDQEKVAQEIKDRILGGEVKVKSVHQRERRKNPVPPFTTSKLQQEAFRKLGFNVKKTMSVAQSLYEGVDLDGEGPVGLITYMRTDSTRLSDDSVTFAREYIQKKYGPENLPEKPVQYRTKKTAQDAHEAIRPTSLEITPEKVSSVLSKEQYSLYRLIWNRFIACQMKPAVYDQMSIDMEVNGIGLRASGSRLIFKGFLEVYEEGKDESRKRADEDDDEASEAPLPPLKEGEVLKTIDVALEQHFTQAPPRFNESSLVKELDEKGIGRPSTYATILSTITERGYVKKAENRYEPTALGEKVNELLIAAFPEILSVLFTAGMEENLDKVEEGTVDWHNLLKDFYRPFAEQVKEAESKMVNVKASSEPTTIPCDRCDGVFHVKWSSRGEFLGCANYPKCRNTREFTRDNTGAIQIKLPSYTGDKCAKCGKDMVLRQGRYGDYIACVDYPSCPTVKSIHSDVKCPEEGCSGTLVQRKTRAARIFWGCTNYPGCQYAVWEKPITMTCEACQFPLMMEKTTKKDGTRFVCPKCKHISLAANHASLERGDAEDQDEAGQSAGTSKQA
jgi:DNA topoisomerase-1